MTLTDIIPTKTEPNYNEGNAIVLKSINRNINFVMQSYHYNRKRIFSRARYLYKIGMTWSKALKQSWAESKKVVLRARREMLILKAQLNRFYSPIQYHQTSEYAHKQMIAAHNRGTNLNK